MSDYLGKNFPKYDLTAKAASAPANSPATPAPLTASGPLPAAPVANPPAQRPLGMMIKPAARDRWVSSLLRQYTPGYVENICRGAMAGNLMSQWLMFDLMEQTWPRLTKNLNELKNAVIDLEWNLQPFALKGQKPTPEAQRRASVIEYILWNMSPDRKSNENDFEDTIYDMQDALGKSIAVLEMDIPDVPIQVDLGNGPQSIFPIRCTRWVHPRYYGYPNYPEVGDTLMLNAKEVRFSNPGANVGDGMWVPFPDDKFIVSIIKQKSGHPINSGMLRMLGFWWASSNFVWEWSLNFAQIFGVPIRWASYAENSPQETINLIESLLQNMGSSGYAAFPAGTDLKIIEAAKSGGDNPQKMWLDAADTICDLVILDEAMSSEHGGPGGRGGGTKAAAGVGKTKRDEKIHAVAKRNAKTLNQEMIRPLCRINFGDEEFCPYLQPAAAESKDGVAVATKYKTILSIPGVEVSKQQFYQENDLVVPATDDDKLIGQAGGPQQTPPGNGGGDDNSGGEGDEGPVAASARARHRGCNHAQARAADAQLVDNALADATGIAPRWLGAVRPIFEELIAKAKDASVTDDDFVEAVRAAQKILPDAFDKMDHTALARVIEGAMGAATVNGAVRGAMRRAGTRQAQEVLT